MTPPSVAMPEPAATGDLRAFYASYEGDARLLREYADQQLPAIEERLTHQRRTVAGIRRLLDAATLDLLRLEQLRQATVQILHPEEAVTIELRGAALGEVAVQTLRHSGSDEPIHYRAWYEMLVAAGHTVGGTEPLATFLTAFTRHPRVERVGGNRSGTYHVVAEDAA